MNESSDGAGGVTVPPQFGAGTMVQYSHPTDGKQVGKVVDHVPDKDGTMLAKIHRHTLDGKGKPTPTNPPQHDMMPMQSLAAYEYNPADETKTTHIEIVTPKKGNRDALEYKAVFGATTSINGRTVDGLGAVFGNIDDASDVLHAGAFHKALADRRRGIPYLWNHDLNAPPIATLDDMREIGRRDLPVDVQEQYPDASGGMMVRRTYLDTPRASEIFAGVTSGAIAGISFGFDALKKNHVQHEGKAVRNLFEVRLWEWSDTPVPANPATRAVKSALAFRSGPLAAKDAPWDGPGEVAKATPDQLKDMCAWCAAEGGDTKDDYKFPYKTADGKLNFKAAVAGMGRLNQADIPASDRKGVYDVLAKVYRAFGEEPPDYKALEIVWSVSDARNLLAAGVEFKAGRTISAATGDKLKTAHDGAQEAKAKIAAALDSLEQIAETLEDLLGLAEPPDDEAAEDGTSAQTKALKTTLIRLELARRQAQLMGVR